MAAAADLVAAVVAVGLVRKITRRPSPRMARSTTSKSDGTTIVIKAGDEFELLSTNKITEDKETFSGTPAISDGQIIVRSDKHLYCISQSSAQLSKLA